jgi:hypothetical protein
MMQQPAEEVLGRCSSEGWSLDGTGPNCTYVGGRIWRAQLLVGSCARNIRAALDGHSREWITSLLDQVNSHEKGAAAMVFEDEQRSGDPDGTRRALRAWAAQDTRVRLILAAPLLYPRWSRTQRLALCRNMLIREAARKLRERGTFVSVDLDCRPPPAPTVAHAIATMNVQRRWDVLTVNTPPPAFYYDRWALRSSTLGLDYDCWFNASQKRAHGGCFDYAITIDAAAPPFAVDSAFNGLGIYRASSLRSAPSCEYRGTKNSYLCEHVPFHLCLRSHGAAIGVLPSLAVDCGATVTAPKRLKRVSYLANGTLHVVLPPNWNESAGTARAKRPKHRG